MQVSEIDGENPGETVKVPASIGSVIASKTAYHWSGCGFEGRRRQDVGCKKEHKERGPF
jgi:hypothetical protein